MASHESYLESKIFVDFEWDYLEILKKYNIVFLNFITPKTSLLDSQIQSGLTNMIMWKCFDTKERWYLWL